MIAELECVVLDCPDPKALADFYAQLIGGKVTVEEEDWVTLSTAHGAHLAFQLAPDHQPPAWPDPARPQQFHLDLRVRDLDEAQEQALGIGARLLDDTSSRTFRVYADPAGHPFCLCLS